MSNTNTISRRGFIALTAGALTLSFGGSRRAIALSQAQNGHEIIWGGLGYNRPAIDIKDDFPLLHTAMDELGGFHLVVDEFIDQLKHNYQGEWVDDRREKMRLADVEGALIFQVSFDDEYLNRIPSGFSDSNKEHVTIYLYAQAQVLYLKGPDSNGNGGEIRALYNFPFRVSRAGASVIGDGQYRTKLTADALMRDESSLINTFGEKVANKAFIETFVPNSIQVSSVTVSTYAETKLKELGLIQSFDELFWGQTFTSSLAMSANISMLPFRANDTLGVNGLAARFDESSKLLSMAAGLEKNKDNRDYLVELTVHKILRKPNGSSSTNVLYSRGMSAYIRVINNNFGEVVFDKKIYLIESHELPKHNFSLIEQYDEKYLTQIAIKLFDLFGQGVMSEDRSILKKIGLKKNEDMVQVSLLKQLLLKCRYDIS